MQRPKTRKEAKEKGLTRYYTGVPCKHGHDAERMASNGKCVGCKGEEVLAYYRSNEGKKIASERQKKWYAANIEQAKKSRKDYYDRTKTERVEVIAFCNARWRENNPGAMASYCAKRRADLIQRTPLWADLKAIRIFYENCPPGYHVDHIVPLRGKMVSGLHVHTNLQYLTKSENLSKLNKWGE